MNTISMLRKTAMLLAALALAVPLRAEPDAKVLRVCADPNNLPLSNKAGAGYENQIAELIGKELGRPVEYVWSPQRMGFIRNTLRASDGHGGYRCDVVMGVPADYDMTANTRPYLHSTWVMVIPDRPEFAGVKTADDVLALSPEALHKLRFGVFTRTPPLDWIFAHKLFDQAVTYPVLSGDPDEFPGQVVANDLAAGKIDVAMVWGPIGGYFAKRSKEPLRLVPFKSTAEMKFDYLLSIGVRQPDKAWRDTLDGILAKHRTDIDHILQGYGVPQMALPADQHAGGHS